MLYTTHDYILHAYTLVLYLSCALFHLPPFLSIGNFAKFKKIQEQQKKININ